MQIRKSSFTFWCINVLYAKTVRSHTSYFMQRYPSANTCYMKDGIGSDTASQVFDAENWILINVPP